MKFSFLNKVPMAMLAIALLSPYGTVAAETSWENRPWEKFGIQAGYFLAAVDSGVRLGTGLGVDIDVEDLLKLDSSNSVFRVGALWRFTDNRRHRLDLSWFSLNRDGSRRIGQEFTFEDVNGDPVTVDAGTEVSAFFDLDIYQFAYSYSFLQDDRIDLAGSLGLYLMPIDVGFTVSGLVEERGNADFTAPLPVLGLRMDVVLAPRWFFRSGVQAFYLEYENFVGHVLQANAAVEYAPWKHVGIGLGFDTLSVSVEAEDEDWPGVDFNGKINFDYMGLQLYLRCFF
ncbi:hypothetical protein DSCW_22540 [Desulfosarcina widdelii]|uniref:Outer membrane protein beta-barrel domain-containing protein n=1 Tax=Desulfosarcina widdelii TaxID=947919 RepID=A0A5K7ZFF5_9BACT|nr:hypothetical protein [Desulfosarcina widdelii]BBO74837.1 hypothetical protein DSCW_22540 [Desulfosarcina widdelii]